MSPVSGANGTFAYTVNYPAGVNRGSLIVTDMAGTPVSLMPISLDSSLIPAGGSLNGNVSLAPGYYLASLTLEKTATGYRAADLDVLHIYTGQTTVAVYTFSPGDFEAAVPLGLGINVRRPPGTGISSVVLKLWEDNSGALTTTALNPSQFVLIAESPDPGAGNLWRYSLSGLIPYKYLSLWVEPVVIANGTSISLPAERVFWSLDSDGLNPGNEGVNLIPANIYGIATPSVSGGTLTAN
jgi:hypothetical protein